SFRSRCSRRKSERNTFAAGSPGEGGVSVKDGEGALPLPAIGTISRASGGSRDSELIPSLDQGTRDHSPPCASNSDTARTIGMPVLISTYNHWPCGVTSKK